MITNLLTRKYVLELALKDIGCDNQGGADS
jgi:hypothetical protein